MFGCERPASCQSLFIELQTQTDTSLVIDRFQSDSWPASSLREVSLITTHQPSASFLAEAFPPSPLLLSVAFTLTLNHTSPYEWVTVFQFEPFRPQQTTVSVLTMQGLKKLINTLHQFKCSHLQLPHPLWTCAVSYAGRHINCSCAQMHTNTHWHTYRHTHASTLSNICPLGAFFPQKSFYKTSSSHVSCVCFS